MTRIKSTQKTLTVLSLGDFCFIYTFPKFSIVNIYYFLNSKMLFKIIVHSIENWAFFGLSLTWLLEELLRILLGFYLKAVLGWIACKFMVHGRPKNYLINRMKGHQEVLIFPQNITLHNECVGGGQDKRGL